MLAQELVGCWCHQQVAEKLCQQELQYEVYNKYHLIIYWCFYVNKYVNHHSFEIAF